MRNCAASPDQREHHKMLNYYLFRIFANVSIEIVNIKVWYMVHGLATTGSGLVKWNKN